jgi:hypothetical protein
MPWISICESRLPSALASKTHLAVAVRRVSPVAVVMALTSKTTGNLYTNSVRSPKQACLYARPDNQYRHCTKISLYQLLPNSVYSPTWNVHSPMPR